MPGNDLTRFGLRLTFLGQAWLRSCSDVNRQGAAFFTSVFGILVQLLQPLHLPQRHTSNFRLPPTMFRFDGRKIVLVHPQPGSLQVRASVLNPVRCCLCTDAADGSTRVSQGPVLLSDAARSVCRKSCSNSTILLAVRICNDSQLAHKVALVSVVLSVGGVRPGRGSQTK